MTTTQTRRTYTTIDDRPSTMTQHIILSTEDRSNVERMIAALKDSMDTEAPDTLVEEVLAELVRMPGADTAEALRPLVKCLPTAVVATLPEILKFEGVPGSTAMLSYVGKDLMFRMEMAVAHGLAFLALTDLACDTARQLRRSQSANT